MMSPTGRLFVWLAVLLWACGFLVGVSVADHLHHRWGRWRAERWLYWAPIAAIVDVAALVAVVWLLVRGAR